MNKPVILITGANRGIGLEICYLLGAENLFTIIFSSRNSTEGQKKTDEIRKRGIDIHYLHLDLSDHKSMMDKIDEIRKRFGSISILVNNAGVYLDSENLDEFPSFLEVTPQILEKTLDINFFGPILLSKLIYSLINENGLIINVSSGGGKLNTTGDRSGHIAYRLSKMLLNVFTKSFSKLKTQKEIKIISVCPGWVKSSMGGLNAPRSLQEGAMDILEVIKNHSFHKSGVFLYNLAEQKF